MNYKLTRQPDDPGVKTQYVQSRKNQIEMVNTLIAVTWLISLSIAMTCVVIEPIQQVTGIITVAWAEAVVGFLLTWLVVAGLFIFWRRTR